MFKQVVQALRVVIIRLVSHVCIVFLHRHQGRGDTRAFHDRLNLLDALVRDVVAIQV